MLSFERGKPIAIIKGGKYDGKIVNVFDPDKKCCDKCTITCTRGTHRIRKKMPCCDNCTKDTCSNYDCGNLDGIKAEPYEVLNEDFIRSHKKKMSISDMNSLRLALEKNRRPDEEYLREVFQKCKDEYKTKCRKELIIHDDGIIQPLPNYQDPERTYIAGPSGSGKSTYVSRYLEKLKKVFPDRDIFLFSDVEQDEVLDKIGLMRMKLDEEFMANTPLPQTLNDSIVIFDDIDSIADKKIMKRVQTLRDSLLMRGRHEDISVVVTNHLLTNYNETRTTLNEVNSITFFPKSGSSHGIQYMLKNYVGLSAKQIQKIFTLPSRWITVYKHCPMYVVSEKQIYL